MSSAHVSLAITQPPSVLAEHERAEAVPVAHAEQVRLVHQHERERAVERGAAPSRARVRGRGRRSGASSSYSPASSSPISSLSEVSTPGSMPRLGRELLGVREVAVVAEREAGVGDRAVHRLRVAPRAAAGRRVAHVADREVTFERREPALVEHLRDETHVLDDGDRLAVADRDAGRLLAAVLEGVEAEVREVGHRLAGGVHTEDAARVSGPCEICVQGVQYPMRGGAGIRSNAR